MVVTLLTGSPVEQVAEWAEQYNLSFPVLADESYTGNKFISGGIPSTSLIAPGGEIIIRDAPVTDEDIEAVLPW